MMIQLYEFPDTAVYEEIRWPIEEEGMMGWFRNTNLRRFFLKKGAS